MFGDLPATYAAWHDRALECTFVVRKARSLLWPDAPAAGVV
jgi:hypothetical protein